MRVRNLKSTATQINRKRKFISQSYFINATRAALAKALLNLCLEMVEEHKFMKALNIFGVENQLRYLGIGR